MENTKLEFRNLYQDFKNIFPQYADFFIDKEEINSVDINDGAHVTFAFCVVPLIFKLVDEKKDDELKKAFDFFELMASSKDSLISEVVAFTILENICTNGKYFNYLEAFFGENTKKLIPLLKQFININNID